MSFIITCSYSFSFFITTWAPISHIFAHREREGGRGREMESVRGRKDKRHIWKQKEWPWKPVDSCDSRRTAATDSVSILIVINLAVTLPMDLGNDWNEVLLEKNYGLNLSLHSTDIELMPTVCTDVPVSVCIWYVQLPLLNRLQAYIYHQFWSWFSSSCFLKYNLRVRETTTAIERMSFSYDSHHNNNNNNNKLEKCTQKSKKYRRESNKNWPAKWTKGNWNKHTENQYVEIVHGEW